MWYQLLLTHWSLKKHGLFEINSINLKCLNLDAYLTESLITWYLLILYNLDNDTCSRIKICFSQIHLDKNCDWNLPVFQSCDTFSLRTDFNCSCWWHGVEWNQSICSYRDVLCMMWIIGAGLTRINLHSFSYHPKLNVYNSCSTCAWNSTIFSFNTLRLRQNGRHFADDIFNRIFVNENVRISIEFSLKFVPKGPINNIPALIQIMAWRRPGDKPLSEPMMVSLLTHICHSASMS